MQQIFLNQSPADGMFFIDGEDAHHLGKVVRIKAGEKIRVSTAAEENFICEIENVSDSSISARVLEEAAGTELDGRIYLYQALPKGDRMETVIEKCVELGVYEIIPVEMDNCVVKLDDKKKASKLKRYQTIADTAAKQSKRSIQPVVAEVMNFKMAVEDAKSKADVLLFPYECANGMEATIEALESISKDSKIAIFVGPEGGFSTKEATMAQECMKVISLGKRILRTDTAAIHSVGLVMNRMECL